MPLANTPASPGGTCSGMSPQFFQPSISDASTRAGRRLLIVGREQLFPPHLIVDIENGEIVFQADGLGVPPQDFHANGMEGAKPRHAFDDVADDLADAGFHLARRLIGKGDREDFARSRAPGGENVGDAHREHAGLAGAGTGQHQHRPVERFDGKPLLRVQAGEIGRRGSAGPRTRGDTAGHGQRRVARIEALSQGVSQGADFP